VHEQSDNNDHEQSANFLAFLGLAGVGQAEAATMQWRDIGKPAGKISFVRQKTGRPFQVPIYSWLAPLVNHLLASRNDEDDRKTVFTIRTAARALTNACKRLGSHRFTQRNLRAMCIKRLYDLRVPVKRIGEWQGQSDGGKLIQETYTEVFCDNDAAAEAADLALVKCQNDGS
jgi:integrase